MARKSRIHFPGACYHVIARGNRGQKIYRDDQRGLIRSFARDDPHTSKKVGQTLI
jgi:hypothetical protein